VALESSRAPGQLTEAYLRSVHFARHEDFEWEALRYTLDSETKAELAGDRQSVRVTLRAEIHWHRQDDGEQSEGPFDLKLEVGGEYAWDRPDLTDEDIVGWVEFNSQHLLWPYLRSYVSLITTASGLPALTLYTITAPHPTLGRADDAPSGAQALERSENPSPGLPS
jgi:preprotein translocase subunit SecB